MDFLKSLVESAGNIEIWRNHEGFREKSEFFQWFTHVLISEKGFESERSCDLPGIWNVDDGFFCVNYKYGGGRPSIVVKSLVMGSGFIVHVCINEFPDVILSVHIRMEDYFMEHIKQGCTFSDVLSYFHGMEKLIRIFDDNILKILLEIVGNCENGNHNEVGPQGENDEEDALSEDSTSTKLRMSDMNSGEFNDEEKPLFSSGTNDLNPFQSQLRLPRHNDNRFSIEDGGMLIGPGHSGFGLKKSSQYQSPSNYHPQRIKFDPLQTQPPGFVKTSHSKKSKSANVFFGEPSPDHLPPPPPWGYL